MCSDIVGFQPDGLLESAYGFIGPVLDQKCNPHVIMGFRIFRPAFQGCLKLADGLSRRREDYNYRVKGRLAPSPPKERWRRGQGERSLSFWIAPLPHPPVRASRGQGIRTRQEYIGWTYIFSPKSQ